jgi:hypothetical protein
MKTFQKITLAAAISAAPFMAQAELTPMDDALMGDTTGQAGVTIEINIQDTGVTVGEIEYKDEGSVLVKGVTLTGWDAAANGGAGAADEVTITQEIDVLENGSVAMVNSTAAGQQLRIQVAGVELQDNTAGSTALNSELVNGVDLKVELGTTSTTTIHNVDIATQTLGDFGVTGSYATSVSGLVIEADAAVAIKDLDVGLFGYTKAQANIKVAQSQGTTVAALDVDGDGVLDNAALETAAVDAAGAAAINIKDVTFDDGAGGTVNIEQTIWADSTGVYIQMGAIAGDLNVGAVEIGGASIGSIAVRDINLAGLTQKIYGH